MKSGYASLLFLLNYLIATTTIVSYHVADHHPPFYAQQLWGSNTETTESPSYVVALDPYCKLTIHQGQSSPTQHFGGIFESTEEAVVYVCWEGSDTLYTQQILSGATLHRELTPGMTILMVVGGDTGKIKEWLFSSGLLWTAARRGVDVAWQRVNTLGLSQGVSFVHIRVGTDVSVATIETRQVQALENTNQPLTMAQYGVATFKGPSRSSPPFHDRFNTLFQNPLGPITSNDEQRAPNSVPAFLEPGTWVMRLDCTEEERDGPFIVASTSQASNTCILLNLHGQYEMPRMRYCLRRCTFEEVLKHAPFVTAASNSFSVGDCVMAIAPPEWHREGPFRLVGVLGSYLLELLGMEGEKAVSFYIHPLWARRCDAEEQRRLSLVDPIGRQELD